MSSSQYKKWIDLGLALAALCIFLLFSQMLEQIWSLFHLPMGLDLPVPIPSLLALAIAVAAFFLVRVSARVMEFLNDVATELAKVTWPNVNDTMKSAGVIIVMVGIASIIMFLFDTLWGTLTRSFLTL